MKQCPVCEKTFDDNMRFCQSDGTALVEKAEPVDPYKTMVASTADIAAAMNAMDSEPPPAVPAPKEEEVLEIPEAAAVDPNKTQFVSEAELRAEMAANEPVIDVPPMAEPPAPPVFSEPSPSPPSFGDASAMPPPSPFSSEAPPAPTTPAIPSPFDAPPPAASEPPATPQFTDSPPAIVPPLQASEPATAEEQFNPFEHSAPQSSAPIAQAEWTPPAVPESNMQNQQNFGQNPQFSQPPAAGGPNSTLAIVSLVLGILGLTVCCGSFIISLAAIVTGFMAKSKAGSDPANYGGAGLALGGIITGALGLIGSVIVIIAYFFYFAAIMANM